MHNDGRVDMNGYLEAFQSLKEMCVNILECLPSIMLIFWPVSVIELMRNAWNHRGGQKMMQDPYW